jgi:lysophospholipase L1-like esterase
MTLRLKQNATVGGLAIGAGDLISLSSAAEQDMIDRGAADRFQTGQYANGVPVRYVTSAPVNPPHGHRLVLFGDSMVETFQSIAVASAASYDRAAGTLSLTVNGHQMASGWRVRAINRSYPSMKKGRELVVTVTGTNDFTVQIPPGLLDLPSGALSGTTQVRLPSWQSAQSFVTWFLGYSGWRFAVANNGAQSGDTTADCLARLDDDCLSFEPSLVIMQMPGINDLSDGNGPVDEHVIWANQIALIERILASGARLIVLTMSPVATGEAAGRATLQKMQSVVRLNRRLKDFCQQVGVIVFDAWAVIVNPTNTTGLAAAAYLRNAPDSIHYSMRGGELVGRSLWNAIKSIYPSDHGTLPVSAADSFAGAGVSLTSVTRAAGIVSATATSHGFRTGEIAKVQGGSAEVLNAWVPLTRVDANTVSFPSAGANGSIPGTITLGRNNNLFGNPLLTTLGGTIVAPVTGTSATDSANLLKVQRLTGSGAAVASMVARADGLGNNQRIVITPGSASDSFDIELDFTPSTDTLPKSAFAGRTYVAEAEMSLSGVSGSNLTEIRWNLIAVVGGVTVQTYALNGYADGPSVNANVSAFHLRTAPLVMPAGLITSFKFMMVLQFGAAGTAITLDLGRIALREVDVN